MRRFLARLVGDNKTEYIERGASLLVISVRTHLFAFSVEEYGGSYCLRASARQTLHVRNEHEVFLLVYYHYYLGLVFVLAVFRTGGSLKLF